MSLTRNVLLKESFAQEKRRRSLNLDCDRDGSVVPRISGGASLFPIFVEDNEDVFTPSSEKGEKDMNSELDDNVKAIKRCADDDSIDDAGKENKGKKSSPMKMLRHPSRVKRRRPLCDESLPHTRGRSSSPSAFPIIRTGSKSSISKKKPVQRWTKVDDEWVPIGGVRKRIPGGLKDRLLKMREKRARRAAQTPAPASNGQENDLCNVEEQSKESTPEREHSEKDSTDMCRMTDVHQNIILEESEVPWSV